MKKSVYLFMVGAMATAFTLTSCDSFLEEKPEDMKTQNQNWQKPADALTGVNATYNAGAPALHNMDISGGWTPKATMWDGIISGLFVDRKKDRNFTSAAEGCTFTLEAFTDQAQSIWDQLYSGIAKANDVIANVPKMTNVLSQSEIDNYVAQAKFFRALNYFTLVKEFGDVPYIDQPYTSTNDMYKERLATAEIYKNIEAELLGIINGNALPNTTFYKNKGRVTKSMAQTLLAQVYLQWAGAPVNGGNEYYTKAANMAKQVISGPHQLEQPNGSSDDLKSAFNTIKTSKSSDEIIYAKEYDYTNSSIGSSYHNRSVTTEVTQWKNSTGGSVFKTTVVDNMYLPCDMIINSYAPEDIRGHEKQFFFSEYTDASGVRHTMSTVGNWAWFDETAMVNGTGSDLNIPIMRYSEVLLIAAEGLARTNDEPNARKYLNEVRKRAGLADETASGNDLIQAILTERLHEFPLEFKVWDDIRRTRLYPQESTIGKLNWVALASAKIQNKPAGQVKEGALPEYVLLWPIPQDELGRNGALTPNAGWK